ncbi:methyl-accepting chemotaxis protein [Tissierella sp. MSJ-40]|uniref:Methyl-accepting chemotaxis protein n=1 Tax=Tissierella simiarum TaxID=2841534 RepID=A0ABS6E8L7_9FIRM|nr:methyl-accepting chemotaxis protein [Tissierella simiarum]MBU5439259.1 methyl-accepting chemotaxis protein [Tissierella simiarum]
MSKLGIKILKIVSLIVVVCISFIALGNFLIFQLVNKDLKEEAEELVVELQTVINGNELEKIKKERTIEELEYVKIQRFLVNLRNSKQIKYVYTLGRKEDGTIEMLVDGNLSNPIPIGEKYETNYALEKAFNGEVKSTNRSFSDEHENFLSAYAPIKNSSGEVIGVVGCDKDISSFIAIKSRILLSVIITSLIVIVVTIILGLKFSKKISHNVKEIKRVLDIMGEGDFTVPLEIISKDEIEEIGKSIDNLRIKTAAVFSDIHTICSETLQYNENLLSISEEMSASSQEVAASIEEMADGTNSQASEMSEMTNTISHFGKSLDNVVRIVEEVSNKVDIINRGVAVSNEDLSTLETSTKDINEVFIEVKDRIKGLGNNLNQINEISDFINSIAEQTNLLALNAAIEAARAGEAGKGFSVVADEIRKLAEQSKDSSIRINNISKNVIKESEVVVNTSENMNEKLMQQISIINNSLSSYKDIINSIEDILPNIQEVNFNIGKLNEDKVHIMSNIENTTAVAEEVSASSQQIAAATEELNVSSEEVAKSAANLNDRAKKLVDSIMYFRI